MSAKLSELLTKEFLNGDGLLTIQDNDSLFSLLLNSDESLSKKIFEGNDKLLIFNLDVNQVKDLSLGNSNSFSLSIKGGVKLNFELKLIWHGDEDISTLKEFNVENYLNDDIVFLILELSGEGEANATLKQSWANYGVSGNFGIDAGGDAKFIYLRPFVISKNTPKSLFKTFFSNLRLPQNVLAIDKVPIEGEVLSFTYGGYLKMNAGIKWGYSINKMTDISFEQLNIKSKAYIQAKAGLNLGYKLAGNFDIQVTKGEKGDSWARVILKKSKERNFEIAVDLSVGAKIETESLPDTPNEFLEAILDLRTTDLITKINALIQDPDKAIDLLKTELDDLTKYFLEKYLGKTLDQISSNQEIKDVYNRLNNIKEVYDELGSKMVGYLEDVIDEIDVNSIIGKIEKATDDLTNAIGLEKISENLVWEFLKIISDSEWIDIIQNVNWAFDKLKEKIKTIKKSNLDALKEFIDKKKASLNLDSLFKDIELLDPDKLKDNTNKYLIELVHRITGDKIKDLDDKLNEAKKIVFKVKDFSDSLYKKFKEALNSSYELSLAYNYRHSDEKDALIDVEINLSTNNGTELMQQALVGDFSSIFKIATDSQVLIHKGLLTHKIKRSSQLNISIFGWDYNCTSKLITNTEETIQQKDDGILYIYNTEVSSEEIINSDGETTEVKLVFNIISKCFQQTDKEAAEVIDTIDSLSSNYSLKINDPVTTDDELLKYIQLADYLQLIPAETGLQGFLQEIKSQLNSDYGNVSLFYRIKYDSTALLNIFTLPETALNANSRYALRNIGSVGYSEYSFFANLSEVYKEDSNYFRKKSDNLRIDSPGDFEYPTTSGEKISLNQHQRKNLFEMYSYEDDFIKSLLHLKKIINSAESQNTKPEIEDLENSFKIFVNYQSILNEWMEFGGRSVINPLLAVLNRLTSIVSGNNKPYVTTLEIMFEKGNKTTRKFLVS